MKLYGPDLAEAHKKGKGEDLSLFYALISAAA